MIEREKIIRTLILIVFFYCFFNYPTKAQSLPSESLESEEILTEQITTGEILGNDLTRSPKSQLSNQEKVSVFR